jgi:AmmeMemoRadiSam system protein B
MKTRGAAVAGAFYPSRKEELERQLKELLEGIPKQERTSCVVAPHAGYVYSGRTAAYSFKALKESKTFVLVGPSHTGLGEPISVSDADEWETPLGKVAVDTNFRTHLLEVLGIEMDDLAHIQEHSLEVQVPFLQAQFKGFKIVPITVMEHDFSELEKLGKAMAAIKGDFSVIASGDFTHHEPLEQAREKDLNAVKKIEAMDAKGFYQEVVSKSLSICGLAPITVLMHYAREKGLTKGKLLHYDTSATASGDEASVVGYASIGFY